MLTKEEMSEIKEELLSAKNPLFLFHDDADGFASFLQFYKQVRRGKWITVKSTPNVDKRFYASVQKHNPDKIFLLDLAMVTQEFVDTVKRAIIWIDHHEVSSITGVKYYNPRKNEPGDNTCISTISYDIFKDNFWLCAAGTVGDWQLPERVRKKILEDMPQYFSTDITSPEKALFETGIGKLSKILNFSLKGDSKDVQASIRAMIAITSASEILEGTSDDGKYIMQRYNKIEEEYGKLIKDAIKHVDSGKLIVYTYEENKISLTGELSNELLYRFPNKVIVIARHCSGEMRISFRSGKGLRVRDVVEKAMAGINGRFGGHEHACGGSVSEHDWEKFILQMRDAIK